MSKSLSSAVQVWGKKFIKKRARKVAPVKNPNLCFAVAAAMISSGWFLLPQSLSYLPHAPIFGKFFRLIPYYGYVSEYGGYVLALGFSYVALYPLCRGIQLCYPEELEAYESEQELAF